jgi:voltage-gated potassium channel
MNQIVRIVLVLVMLTLVGTLGFSLIEKWDFLDSLYMSVITLTTVGYREVHDLSTAGRWFVIGYLALGLGAFFYGVVELGQLVVRAQLSNWLEKRRMDTKLKSLRNHFIVCGFGRLGRPLCDELAVHQLPFVVVDRDTAVLAPCQAAGWNWLAGDATEDQTLLEAGIERARGLAAVLSNDAENLYVVLSARLLSRDLQILSRASTEKDAEKLRRAGANRVISLYATGATKMAQLLANPRVEDFIEVITAKGKQIDLTEVQVTPEVSYVKKALAETDFRKRGIIIVGIRRSNGELLLPPAGTDVLEPGDFLIALGKTEAIRDLIEKA